MTCQDCLDDHVKWSTYIKSWITRQSSTYNLMDGLKNSHW